MAEAQPFRGVRKVIADRMMASLQGSAQLTYHGDADVTALMQMRRGWKEQGEPVSLEACVIFALAQTLRLFPAFNATADEQSISVSEPIDISIAISTPAGLMTPVVKDIGNDSLKALADKRRDLIGRAMSGNLSVSEMKGGSFTLSNLGHTRVRYFTPILNAGQVALLGIGRLEDKVSLDADGAVMARQLLPLSLTADHRIIDGEPAGLFLDSLCKALEAFDASP
ncbi:MAG: 2-oxo acid dehydrogenase subunit E2 [Henriciella sp.]|uniref:2-oxo acid dehydrogenase subunit E2 n=1 Tax=Henriciella sp. TaxID=1968823 RepID=UPI0032F05172